MSANSEDSLSSTSSSSTSTEISSTSSSPSTSTLTSTLTSNESHSRSAIHSKTVDNGSVNGKIVEETLIVEKSQETGGMEDFLYDDILGNALDEEEDDLDDRKHLTASGSVFTASSHKHGSTCGNEDCAAMVMYLKTTIGDRDRTVASLEDQLAKIKESSSLEVQMLKTENENIRKQFEIAKTQAAKLRTELRDWLRLPLNRAIVALKKSANLKSVAEIMDIAPALGAATDIGGDNQAEIAEVEKRLKAYHSMLKAKNVPQQPVNSNDSDCSRDSLAGSLASAKSGGILSDILYDEDNPPDEVEEGEVGASDEDDNKKHRKKRKHRHSDHGKKKHHKEPRKVDNESAEAPNSLSSPSKGTGQNQQSGWVDLLRQHVGGNWPKKQPSEEPTRAEIDRRLGARPVSVPRREGSAVQKNSREDKSRRNRHEDSASPSHLASQLESKLTVPENKKQRSDDKRNDSKREKDVKKDKIRRSKSKDRPRDENRGKFEDGSKTKGADVTSRSLAQHDENDVRSSRKRSRSKSREKTRDTSSGNNHYKDRPHERKHSKKDNGEKHSSNKERDRHSGHSSSSHQRRH